MKQAILSEDDNKRETMDNLGKILVHGKYASTPKELSVHIISD
jgi:hypothetical protein